MYIYIYDYTYVYEGRGRKAATNDDLDDDEKAMMKGEDDGDEEGNEPQGTVLLTQPSSVSGGAMRSYQLEGLNWMIRLQENGKY
jgi:SWI/SNF-related matrix-associated actin-dependent regulator of chromatin subfamily A member 5